MRKPRKTKRIGIIGGMGPLAGVWLQKLIIEATPAKRDQDHLQVICFTNPHIPDRGFSMRIGKAGEEACLKGIIQSGRTLEKAGATVLVIPCNTAHVLFEKIQKNLSVPILHLIKCAVENLAERPTFKKDIVLLATDTTIAQEVYHKELAKFKMAAVAPDKNIQRRVMKIIHGIKAGQKEKMAGELKSVISELKKKGAEAIILGCTELSTCFDDLRDTQCRIIDPLRIAARELVMLCK